MEGLLDWYRVLQSHRVVTVLYIVSDMVYKYIKPSVDPPTSVPEALE